VAAVLHEWAEAGGVTLAVDESQVPVTDDVRGACELLGLDPIHVANEGTMVVAVPAGEVDRALAALRRCPVSQGAARIGQVVERAGAPVIVQRALGRPLPLDEPLGAPLPRIC
jgi:hydrogenase expression/formation protein HypE